MCDRELLAELCMARGISGDEYYVRHIIEREILEYATDIKTDALGNLIVFKKGKKTPSHKLMISAHMDEVGFVVTNVTSDGYIKFAPVGGVDRRVIFGKSVKIGNREISGVVCVTPIHCCSGDERKNIPDINDMYIDIGADNRQDTLSVVSLGDSITFDTDVFLTDKTIMARAIDDRAGCAIMCNMIKSDLEYDMYFTFVTQEEVGLRGAKVAAYTVNPDFALVIESTTASDLPDVPYENQVCNLGEGAVISFMDKSTIYDKELYDLSFNLAKENNIKLQTKRAVAGGNDSGIIHTTRDGVRTLAISIPCRYLHSGTSIISLDDLDSANDIVTLCANKICSGTL